MSKAIDYHAVLADLKAKRAVLDQSIAGIEAVLGEGPMVTGAAGGHSTEIVVDAFIGLNIPTGAAKFLRLVGKPARTTEVITDALNRGGARCNAT